MAVGPFGRRATLPAADTLAGYVPTPPKLRVLRADGQRIDLTARNVGQLLTATRQDWQLRAYSYRDMIGELRYAQRLRSRAVARCRFYVAEVRPWPSDPVPLDGSDHELDKQLAADAVANFARIPFDHQPDGFTSRLDENLGIAGEVWAHIDPDDIFHVRSVSEVSTGQDGRVTLNGLPGGSAGTGRPIDPRTEDLLRLWVPHPQWGQLADAPLRALIDTAEEVVLAGREQRSAARSRLAANGVLLVSEGMTFPRIREADDDLDDDSVASSTFMADFATAMLAPLADDGDPASVVPLVLRGAPEDLEHFRHVTLQRADAEQLIARQSAALVRLLRGMDVQPEQVEGLGSANHWNAWNIDARAIRDQIQPAAETIAAAMMQAFLRPALESLGHRDLSRVTIAVDTSPLSENPNRGQDARDAHTALVISDEALRRELGFDDEDAPTEEEVVRRLASSGRLPVEDVAKVLGLRSAQQKPITVQGEIVEQTALPVGEDRPVAAPGQVTPERPIPAQPVEQPAVVAAAQPDPAEDWRVDTDACRRLADLDAALADRVVIACEAAQQRVVEKAGARTRSIAQKDKTLTASIAGVDAHLVPSVLGRERVESFVAITDLIADSYDRLRAQVTAWLTDHAAQTADAVVAILGVEGRRADEVADQVQSRLATHHVAAWPLLAAELDAAAAELLFDPDPALDDDGETSTALLDVGAVIEALAAAGGEQLALTAAGKSGYGGGRRRRQRRAVKPTPGTSPAAGPATGPVVRGVLAEQGAVNLGFEWSYRPEVLRSTFDPHKQLDGARFTSWRDDLLRTDVATAWIGTHFHPRDHPGCRCTGSVVYGVATDPDSLLAQALRDAHGRPDAIVTAGGTGRSDLARRAREAAESLRATHMSKPRRRR